MNDNKDIPPELEKFFKEHVAGKNPTETFGAIKNIVIWVVVIMFVSNLLPVLFTDFNPLSMIDLLLLSPVGIIGLVIILAIILIKQVDQYERGILFSFGKYSATLEPGWRIVIPIFQSISKVDIRVKAVDVPDQEAMTKDNVSVRINAVIYYRVRDAAKALVEVEDFRYATAQLAQTTMRNVVGEVNLDELLAERDEVSKRIQTIVDKATDPWGIEVSSVELKDIGLNDEMKRVMGKVAEADRERRSVIIRAEGEVVAAENMAKAAKTLAGSPGALHLRTIQTIQDLSSDESNTTVWMVPIEGLKALEGLSELVKKK